MPFIGNQPALAYTSFAVQHFTTSATTSYTLNYPVANENEIRLVINNVVQQPGSSYAYTASGTSLTLSAATTATDTMYAVFLGKAVQTVNPPNGSVGLSQLSATGTKDSTTFLRGDNTFATITSGLTEFDQWRLSTDFDIPTSTTVINSGWERSDEPSYSLIGTGMTESSGVFTFPSTGYYLVTFTAQVASGNYASSNSEIHIQATTDNSSYDRIALGWVGYKGGANPISRTVSTCQAIVDVTSTTNVKVRFTCVDNDNVTIGLEGVTSANHTSATFIKLGNT